MVGSGRNDVPAEATRFSYQRGATIRRYVILEPLGRAGAGTVYKAYDPELDRRIALKVLPLEEGSASERQRRQELLVREAQTLARLAHPNIAAVHDVGTVEGAVFVTMELVEGETLRTWMRDGKRSLREILAVFTAAGQGLAAAHRIGIVHRDFRPDRVILGADGRVRVIDFGLAGAELESNERVLSGKRSIDDETPPPSPRPAVGAPEYMAPELLARSPFDARCDQFSFAIMLHEALYGTLPASERSGRYSTRAPRSRPPVVPGSLRRIVERGFASAPELRYPSMDALLDELARNHAPRVRPWLAVAAAFAVSLAALAGVRHAAGVRALECQGGGSRASRVWSGAARENVRKAFVKVGVPFAEDALRATTAGIDNYLGEWTRMHDEACQATKVRGEQSQELLDLRMQCLGGRLAEVEALVRVLGEADATVVERAPRAVQGLSPLDGCADPTALRSPSRGPEDPATQAQVDSVRKEVAEARALLGAGKFAAGLAVARPLPARAQLARSRAMFAEAQLVLAELEERNGDYEQAATTLRRTIPAADAARHDEVRARALLVEAWLVGERLGHPAEGLAWADYAEGVTERLERRDALLAGVERVRGVLFYRLARFEEALGASQRCKELRVRALGASHPDVAECLSDLGIALSLMGRSGEALQRAEEALALWERALGPNHVDVALALTNVGDVLRAEGRLDEAMRDYQRASGIWAGTGHVLRAEPVKGIGDVLRAQGRYAEALENYREATRIWQEVFPGEHARVAACLSGEADALRLLGRLPEASAKFEAALTMRERTLGLDHPDLAIDLVGLAEVDLVRNAPSAAVARLERALALRQPRQGNPSDLADTRFALARALAAAHRDGKRVIGLAQEARAFYVARGSGPDAARVDAFLAAHPSP